MSIYGLPQAEVEEVTLDDLDSKIMEGFLKQMKKEAPVLEMNASNSVRLDRDAVAEFTNFREDMKANALDLDVSKVQFSSRKMSI